jgi:S1-C subfamily serine protease
MKSKKPSSFVKSVVLSVALSVGAILGLVHTMPEAQPDFQSVRQSVVYLERMVDGELEGFCSGVKITETEVLTAAHCDLDEPLYVHGYKAQIVKKDEEKDLMLLHVPVGSACPCVPNAVLTPKQDGKVYIVGFPLSAGQVVTEGTYQSEDEEGYILVTAPATYGNSGGGIFMWHDGHWVLIGILTKGTIIPLGGFFPAIIGHLNYGSGGTNIFKFLTDVREPRKAE